MIAIINGSVGVGKAPVSCSLQERFRKSAMLDGDHIEAVGPFRIYDESRIKYLYRTLVCLVSFHKKNGYDDFVVNYVFENSCHLNSLIELFKPLDNDIHNSWLICSDAEQKRRIRDRKTDQDEWELGRFKEPNRILETSAKHGYIGCHIDTTHSSIKGATGEI
jgi:hypothetical protein